MSRLEVFISQLFVQFFDHKSLPTQKSLIILQKLSIFLKVLIFLIFIGTLKVISLWIWKVLWGFSWLCWMIVKTPIICVRRLLLSLSAWFLTKVFIFKVLRQLIISFNLSVYWGKHLLDTLHILKVAIGCICC